MPALAGIFLGDLSPLRDYPQNERTSGMMAVFEE